MTDSSEESSVVCSDHHHPSYQPVVMMQSAGPEPLSWKVFQDLPEPASWIEKENMAKEPRNSAVELEGGVQPALPSTSATSSQGAASPTPNISPGLSADGQGISTRALSRAPRPLQVA